MSQERRRGLDEDHLKQLVEAGLTVREIAIEVDRCVVTVRRWLARFGLRTHAAQRIATTRSGRAAGHDTVVTVCRVHGETSFVLDAAGYYRCRRCRVEAVVRRRRKVKQILVAEAGGRCVICGYDRFVGALEFHHLDPRDKRLGPSMNGITMGIGRLREEVRKCVLLCSNCHAEVEGGVAFLPVE